MFRPLLRPALIREYAKKVSKKAELKKLTFSIPNYTSVNNLSNLIHTTPVKLMKNLQALGFSDVTPQYILTKEYIQLILQEYNYEIPQESLSSETIYDSLKPAINPKNLKPRTPIVTIMGHVDHGKTTLLDYLRKSSVVESEHGGITQHIGAFQVVTPETQRKITFLDTPGHAAFLKMRERGAGVTDIVVLCISAEDGVKPQTLEAIKHVQSSGSEMLVALTKVDKVSAKHAEAKRQDIEGQLLGMGIECEIIPISARTGQGMDLLEESIVVLADVMDLRTEYQTTMQGVVLESHVDKSLGNAAVVLLTRGTLKKSDILVCGNTWCRVRKMSESHKDVSKAEPAQAVLVVGWKELPHAGDEIIQVKNESIAKKFTQRRIELVKTEQETAKIESSHVETVEESVSDGPKKINLIVKCDVSGSEEAVVHALEPLGNEEIQTHIVASSVGSPTPSDVQMAQLSGAHIVCFNVPVSHEIKNMYKEKVHEFTVIYKLIEDVTEILRQNLTPIYETKVVSTIEIRQIFDFKTKKGIIKIAGCKVVHGSMFKKSNEVKILRNGEEVYRGALSSLKNGKEEVTEVKKGGECGVCFENWEGFQEGDIIESIEDVAIERYI